LSKFMKESVKMAVLTTYGLILACQLPTGCNARDI
jgi:hypothetical protein